MKIILVLFFLLTLVSCKSAYETKLNDSEYKDAEQYDAQFGDKYNENFLKDLAKNKETPEVSLAEKYAEEVAKETKKKK